MDRKMILIVDDEQNIRSLLKRMLEKDYTVLEAANGLEAVDAAKNVKPDLIIMDLMMPGVDGYTASSAIRTDSRTRSIPIIMLTAISLELNKQLADRIGANGYLTKPFNQPDLMKAIGALLETT